MSDDTRDQASDANPYTTTAADLSNPQDPGGYGSVEAGLAGDYALTIGGTISEAWAATSGNKATVWGAALLFIAVAMVYFIVTGAVSLLLGGADGTPSLASSVITFPLDLIYYGIYSVMGVGMYTLGAKISMGVPASAGEVLRFVNSFVKGLLTYIAMMLLIMVGFILLILPGIYLSFAYMFALPLAVEKNLPIWEALETSRKAVTKRWFTVAGLFIVVGLLLALSAIPLGIGLIWTVPLAVISYGIAYRNVFGLNGESLSN